MERISTSGKATSAGKAGAVFAAVMAAVIGASAAGSGSLPLWAPNAFTAAVEGPSAPAAAAASTEKFAFTGAAQTVTVPDGIVSARVTLRGGDGGDADQIYFSPDGGDGHTLTFTAPVDAGDVLTVGVGGHGWNHYGGGHTGWSLPGFVGGQGGRGSVLFRGGGGGGASVLEVNGALLAVAAGGGGATYDGHEEWLGQLVGGDGGWRQGAPGGPHLAGGRGGTIDGPELDINGSNADTWLTSGGGGGGGGYHHGQGGPEGHGGGGGASYLSEHASLISEQTAPGTAEASITFLPASLGPAGTAWSIAKEGTTKVLEVSGDSPHDGGTVDLWEQMATTDGHAYANELWTFRPDGDSEYGWLVNNSTGKCLEVNHHTGAVDQWECLPGADNELWRATANSTGGVALQVKSSGAYLGIAMNGTASAEGTAPVSTDLQHDYPNGTPVQMTTTSTQVTAWTLNSHG